MQHSADAALFLLHCLFFFRNGVYDSTRLTGGEILEYKTKCSVHLRLICSFENAKYLSFSIKKKKKEETAALSTAISTKKKSRKEVRNFAKFGSLTNTAQVFFPTVMPAGIKVIYMQVLMDKHSKTQPTEHRTYIIDTDFIMLV